MGADDEARHHIDVLAQRLHQFGHQIEEREMELWHQLSNVVNLPRVEHQLARSQELWKTEYNKFIAELSTFVNKEINDFWCSIVVMSDSIREFRISNTHYHEFAQATS